MNKINKNLFLNLIPFLGYLGLYVLYVLTVIVSAYIYNRQKRSRNSVVQDIQQARGKNPKYMHRQNNESVSQTTMILLFLQKNITQLTHRMMKFPFCPTEPFSTTMVRARHV